MSNTLVHDSTETFKPIIYQFIVALEKCFEMQNDESIWIEKYEGIWDSCYLFNYLGCNYEFVVNEQGAQFISSLINDIKDFNEDEDNNYFVVGAELNYIEDCEIKEHCDDLNFDNRRLRVFLPIYTESYESFIFIEGKEYPVEYGKPILFDCTKPHSGDIDSKVWALIIDLLPKQIETSDILKYLVPPPLS